MFIIYKRYFKGSLLKLVQPLLAVAVPCVRKKRSCDHVGVIYVFAVFSGGQIHFVAFMIQLRHLTERERSRSNTEQV